MFHKAIYAGTHFGIYKCTLTANEWQKVKLPVKQDRIAGTYLYSGTVRYRLKKFI